MTKAEKESIRHLRAIGAGYKTIATRLGLSLDSIKRFCQRNSLTGATSQGSADVCQNCGEPLGEKHPGAEGKKFCSTACRMKWWNRSVSLREPKEDERRICAHCGCAFFSVRARKYCGRVCYTSARFGGERHDDAGAV